MILHCYTQLSGETLVEYTWKNTVSTLAATVAYYVRIESNSENWHVAKRILSNSVINLS